MTERHSEMKLIALDAAQQALEQFKRELPAMMKPALYEVSESVANAAAKESRELLSNIFGADVSDKAQMREVSADFYFLRKQRLAREQDVRLMRELFITKVFKWVLAIIFGSLGLYLGISHMGG